MRRFICFFTATILLIMTFLPNYFVCADENNDQIIYCNNDGYIVVNTKIISCSETRSSYTKTASRTFTYYNSDDVAQWDVVLTASFTYDNITSQCTSSNAVYHIYNSSWSLDRLYYDKAGNAAWADFTFDYKILFITINSYTGSISLSCSSNGTIS